MSLFGSFPAWLPLHARRASSIALTCAVVFTGCSRGDGLATLPAVTPQQAATVSAAVKQTTYFVEMHPADQPTMVMLRTVHDVWHAGGIRIDYIPGNDALFDAIVANAQSLGMKLDFITAHGDASLNPASYAVAAGQAAARYAGHHLIWEIYNEPNLSLAPNLGSGVSGYIALAQATAIAIRANDPTATIITGGTGGPDTTTFSYAIAAGKALAPYVDGVSIHPYGIDYGSFGAAIVKVAAATNRPVYVSEWGDNNQKGLTQAMLSSRGLTPMFNAYEYQEQPAEAAAGDDNWGLLSGAWSAFSAGTQ